MSRDLIAQTETEGGIEMIMFKACPRCQGDMHQNRDMYGEYRECLMCGYMADIAKPGLFGMQLAPAPVRKKVSKRPAPARTPTVRAA